MAYSKDYYEVGRAQIKVIFALHFTMQISFKGVIMLLKELKLIIDEVCLVNI